MTVEFPRKEGGCYSAEIVPDAFIGPGITNNDAGIDKVQIGGNTNRGRVRVWLKREELETLFAIMNDKDRQIEVIE